MRPLITLLAFCLLISQVLAGQPKRKRLSTKKPGSKVELPCGIRRTAVDFYELHPEIDLAAGTVSRTASAPPPSATPRSPGEKPGDWHLAGETTDHAFYYNTARAMCVDNTVGKVWIKSFSTDKESSITHSMSRYELKCRLDQLRVTSVTDYDKDGKVLRSETYDRAKWEDVIPDSAGEEILNTVCHKPDFQNKPISKINLSELFRNTL